MPRARTPISWPPRSFPSRSPNKRMGFVTKPSATAGPATPFFAPSCPLPHVSVPFAVNTPCLTLRSTPFALLQIPRFNTSLPPLSPHASEPSCTFIPTPPAYTLADVTVRSTRAGGAMALLCAGVDSNRIRLVGRWRSDEMYRYLHVQAQPVMTGLSSAMLQGGTFRMTPP